jgi:predicted DNA-binding transcriptional regulator YafY
LIDLEKQLAPAERDLAAALADEAAAQILDGHAPATFDRAASSAAPIARGILAGIRRAIAKNRPLDIVYTDALGVTTTRVVEPHRLEQRGSTHYLIAFCRIDRDERTFRVDRIQTIQALPG